MIGTAEGKTYGWTRASMSEIWGVVRTRRLDFESLSHAGGHHFAPEAEVRHGETK